VFPEAVRSPTLVPETIDEETPLSAGEVVLDDEEVMLVDCVTLTEMIGIEEEIDIEYVTAAPPVPRDERTS
jgi:hypothetical protein